MKMGMCICVAWYSYVACSRSARAWPKVWLRHWTSLNMFIFCCYEHMDKVGMKSMCLSWLPVSVLLLQSLLTLKISKTHICCSSLKTCDILCYSAKTNKIVTISMEKTISILTSICNQLMGFYDLLTWLKNLRQISEP